MCAIAIENIGLDPGLLLCDMAGIKPDVVGQESWAWSHSSRSDQSVILQLTARIEEQGGKDKASSELLRARRRMMSLLLQHDYGAYVMAAKALGGMIDRRDLPNVQDIPYFAWSSEGERISDVARKAPQVCDNSDFRGVCSIGTTSCRASFRPIVCFQSVFFKRALLYEEAAKGKLQDVCLPDGVLISAIFWFFQRVDRALLRRETTAVSDEASGVLVPDCSLPNVTYSESLLDRGLLHVFRTLVTKETGYASKTEVRTDCSNHFLCCSTGSIFFDAS